MKQHLKKIYYAARYPALIRQSPARILEMIERRGLEHFFDPSAPDLTAMATRIARESDTYLRYLRTCEHRCDYEQRAFEATRDVPIQQINWVDEQESS